MAWNDDKSIDDLNLTDGTVEETSISGKRARLVREVIGSGSCGVVVAPSATTAVTINVVISRAETEEVCQKAQQAAPLVLANISKN